MKNFDPNKPLDPGADENDKDAKEERDRKLDEQLEESFPASDPPGYVESEDE